MTLQDVLFKPFTPPQVANVRRHYCGGSPDLAKYALSDELLSQITKRAEIRGRKESEMRNRIYAYISKNPGCTCAQISADLHHSAYVVGAHLSLMLDNKTIVRESRHLSKRGGPATKMYWVSE